MESGAKVVLAVVVALGLSGPAGVAQDEVARYTLDDCIRIGLERSVLTANGRRDQAIADAFISQAGAQARPQLSLSAGYTRLDSVEEFMLEGETVELGTLDNYSATAEISQLLYSGGKVLAAIRAARLSKGYAGHALADAEARLVRDVRTAFYDILLSRSAVAVREESVKQLSDLLAETEEKARNGAASEFDVITARVRLQNEKPELSRIRNAWATGKQDFARLVSLDEGRFDLIGELVFEPLDVDPVELEAAALSNRPILLAMQAAVDLREQDAVAARSGNWPSLNVFAAENGANSYGFASFGDEWNWHWSAGVVMQWNVWDGGLTRGAVREKALLREKALAELADMERGVRVDVRKAYLAMQYARETVSAGRETVALAVKGLEIARARHQNGLSTYLEVTDSNLALSTAKLSASQALRDHLAAVAQLEYVAGLGGADFLQEKGEE